MKRTVAIRAEAKADLRLAHDWYENRCAGLGDEFLAAIAEAMVRLESEAERYPAYYRGISRVLTRRFPFKVFFRIEGDTVAVFRVLHVAQDRQLDQPIAAPRSVDARWGTGNSPLTDPSAKGSRLTITSESAAECILSHGLVSKVPPAFQQRRNKVTDWAGFARDRTGGYERRE